MAEVVYLSKEKLYPRFGYALPSKQIAHVREDLPAGVKRFVTAHELYHLRNKARWWVWKEIKANGAAALKHPFGFFLCLFMSLAPHRWSYYLRRIRGKEA